MRTGAKQKLPVARKDQLIVKELESEVLTYDLSTYQAHCLNPTASIVWKNCDGKKTVAQVVRILEAHLKAPVSPDVVWLALDQLGESRLLVQPASRPSDMNQISRREVARRIGIAALALPLIIAITAPTAQAAGSCVPGGQPCVPPNNCCPPFFCEGTCL